MSKSKAPETFAWIVRQLRRSPRMTYPQLQRKAEAAGHTVWPVMFGRAQAHLGLVRSKARPQLLGLSERTG